MNLSYVAKLPSAGSNSKFKIEEGFESVIKILQFKFIKFDPRTFSEFNQLPQLEITKTVVGCKRKNRDDIHTTIF